MAWRDDLEKLREDLTEMRSERVERYAADEEIMKKQRAALVELAGELGISQLLADMNTTLLEDQGKVEILTTWESPADSGQEDEDELRDLVSSDEDEEEGEVVTSILSWEEAGEREIAVDLGASDEGTFLQVNGVDIRSDREALEQALLEGFRDELEI